MRGIIAALIAAAALAGCAGNRPQQDACASYGYQPGTAAYAGCRERGAASDEVRRQQLMQNAAVLLQTPQYNFPQQRICGWEGPYWVCR